MFDATSPLWGILILAVAIAGAAIIIKTRSNRVYQAEMAKYREALAALNAAQAPAVPAAAPAAAVNVSGGEVVLTGVGESTAAMIIAILCETIGGDPAALHFTAIRAL